MPELVIKRNGLKEPYQKEKVINSLRKIGADEETINAVLRTLDEKFPQIVTTKKLYQEVFNLLKVKKSLLSTKYNLKNAISLLGPAGYSFEKFFAKVLTFYGYETKTNLFLAGKCLVYEIDILAKKESVDYIIECKFHNIFSKKETMKNILYVYGRFIDLKENFPQSQAWLVTNTKFTSEVIHFAECYNLKLTSWNWPADENLFNLIEKNKLYPITILTCCPKFVFKNLIKFEIILVKELLQKEKRLIKKIANISDQEINLMFEEALNLLNDQIMRSSN